MKIRFMKAVHGSTPVLMGDGGNASFGTSPGPEAVMRFLTSPLVLILLALAFFVALFLASPTEAIAQSAIVDTVLLAAPVVAAPRAVTELEEKLMAKAKTQDEVFEKAGDTMDFNSKDVLSLLGAKDSADAVGKLKAIQSEMNEIGKKLEDLKGLTSMKEETDALVQQINERKNKPANKIPLPGAKAVETETEHKSIAELVMGCDAVKNALKLKGQALYSEIEAFTLAQVKTLFQTSAGWAPESVRIPGLVIDKATRPIQVLDIIPTGPTNMAAIKYMEETTRTHNAAERSAAAAYQEDAFALTERSKDVRSIGTSIPVTDEQLQDVAGVQSYLEQRLGFGIRQRLDSQVLNGDDNAPNIAGILGHADIQTQALGGDPRPDAFYKAMVKVRVTGRAFPSAHIIHPNDWQQIRLLTTADGIYIFGPPSQVGEERMWGLQVVQADSLTEGTGLTGDFINFCKLYEKLGLEIVVGYVNDDLTKGKRTIRAGVRVAMAIYRGAAFCKVTGL